MPFFKVRLLLLWSLSVIGWISGLQAQAPVANFSGNNTTACAPFPLVVGFQDQSTGNPTSWLWQFGDGSGSTSTLQNPTFIYSDPGCYDVTLIVSNANGADTLTQPCFVEIFAQPQAGFVLDVNDGCAPLTVSITDTTIANAASITSWAYTLTGGATSNLQNPVFTFPTAPDTLSVFLTVVNSNGCQNVTFIPDAIIVREPPVLDFTVDVNSACNPPLTVNYQNNSIGNGAQNPVYTWSFPGGTVPGGADTAVGFNPPPVTYAADGQYSATLTVESGNGCADTLTINDIVGIGGVTAAFSLTDSAICLGDPITFTNLSTGGVTAIEWDFGETPGVDGTADVETYTYSAPGTYTVTLRAINAACGDTLVRPALITVDPVPTADYTVDRLIDCQPGNPFTFTDQSVNAVAWAWDFGDGTTSAQQNPNHTFTSFGDFDVCLVVTNALGCTDTLCQAISIEPPNVNFNRSPVDGCAPLQVQFTDASTSPVDPIIGWQWNFGTGAAVPPTSNQPTQSVTYPNPGTFAVTLIVVTQNGCTDTLRIDNAIRVGTPPTVDFTADEDTLCINQPVTFTSLFTNPDWDYYWDFQYEAPGNFAQIDSMPTTTYPDTGTYSVALVIDNLGCRDTLIQEDLIWVSPPLADFTVSDSVLCGLPATVAFGDSSIGPADVYEWWINGVTFSNQPQAPPYNITAPGEYIFSQILVNTISGCEDTFSVVVRAGDPQANFSTAVTSGCRALTVPFTNSSQDATNYAWRFDLGGPGGSGALSPTYTYQDTGIYTVRLIAVDNFSGCRDTLIQPDLIEVFGSYAAFGSDIVTGCPGTTIQFGDSTETYFGNPVAWEWDFGDGSPVSTQQNPSHTYPTAGIYDVTLRVTDSNGCTDSVTYANFIEITFPQPSFTVNDDSTCAGNPLTFTNTSTGVGLSFLWDFGDGQTDTLVNPVHAFGAPGGYDVSLVATDINGCVDSIQVPDFIFIEEFEANFGGDPIVGICPPLNTQFADSTIGNVTGWNWTFGDGFGFSFLQNPANVYLTPGTFTVTLIATHEDGCQDTLVRPDYVFVAGPNGAYDVQPDQVCLGDSISITAITSGATCAAFDFRDGVVNDTCGLSGGIDTVIVNHLYTGPDTYAPLIVLEDAQGCVFTLSGQDSTTVFSLPDAAIAPLDSVGCSEFEVPFTDASTPGDSAINQWLWVFGDGDSSAFQNPVHTYVGDSLFNVSLYVQDVNGCVDSAFTTVTVYEGTIPDFIALDTLGCAPFVAEFSDLSSNFPPSAWTWIFGDGDTLTGVSSPTHTYQNDGLYTVTLIVSDNLGCSDTLIKEDYINLRHPEARLYSDVTTGCNPLTITFHADSSIFDGSLVEHEWCLTDLGTGQTTCEITAGDVTDLPVEFLESGTYQMVLTVTDAEGCSGTSDPLLLDITARVIPDPLEMRNVSVVDAQSVEVSWAAYPGTDFNEYAIYRVNGPSPGLVGTITDQAITTFVETNPALNAETQSYCYKVLVQNTCEEYSLLEDTEEHCTVDLETAPALDAIDLSWSAYVGYTVDQYEIYRANTYDPTVPPQQIGVVPGNVRTFTDFETFCYDSISYRVRAVGLGGPDQLSWSDIDANAPNHPLPVETTDVISASVVADSFVTVDWTEYAGYLPDQYIVLKSEGGVSWDTLGFFPLSTRSLIDTAVNVDRTSYFYEVIALDQCGDYSAQGLYGKTILLQAGLDATGRIPQLNWSAYEQWGLGVLNYQVEVLNEQTGAWQAVDQVGAGTRRFADNLSQLVQPTWCYRIRAFEAAGNGAEALSNEACVTFGPQLFVPNAFSPNNDGHNDRFELYAPNLASAELSIFNRWGQMIYQTFNLDDPWDGTFKGSPVPEGVYVFVVRGTGVDGTPVARQGTVTLFR
ncbi:MAG: PKD domain-containing protein [Bacteroidetes bacterium]|nr:MAG: PKD domain-containing protein [Bacteroidota bacterium]